MPKLRKMLGSIESENVKALMALMDTQSRETLAKWAATRAQAHDLPLLKDTAGYNALAEALSAALSCAQGSLTQKALKPHLQSATSAARETTDTPAHQAAARAISVAAAVTQTPTNALGWLFYHAAAQAYTKAGTAADAATYDALAEAEMAEALASLEACAVANEPNPIHVSWGC